MNYIVITILTLSFFFTGCTTTRTPSPIHEDVKAEASVSPEKPNIEEKKIEFIEDIILRAGGAFMANETKRLDDDYKTSLASVGWVNCRVGRATAKPTFFFSTQNGGFRTSTHPTLAEQELQKL